MNNSLKYKLHHFSLEHNSFDTHLTNNQLLTTKILLLKPRNSLSDIDSTNEFLSTYMQLAY